MCLATTIVEVFQFEGFCGNTSLPRYVAVLGFLGS